MDCNIQCCTLVILVALGASCVRSTERSCDAGTWTSGYTEPSGDILLEFGQPLEINCTIYPSSNFNSSSLTFFNYIKEIPKEFLHIVNSTTLRLYIEKPSIQDGMYMCKKVIEGTNYKNYSAVCLNKVIVGLKPQPVTKFTCVSLNWNNLTCSWVPAHNYIRTNYTLGYKPSNKQELSCPAEASGTPNTCFFNATTNPSYRQTVKYYKLVLTGANALGSNKWSYNISHFSVVIPDKPRNLSAISVTINSILLHWSIPFGLEHFPPGVIHNVMYKTIYDNDWQEVNISSLCVKAHGSSCSNEFYLTLPDLKYPNTIYNISVKCRSGREGALPYRWSEPAYITPQTVATVPPAPPRTDIGSFEVVSTNSLLGLRNVNIYWQEIPKYWENGNDFKYKIISVEEDGIVKDIAPTNISRYFANFQNLTNRRYRFKIVSHNEVGSSHNFSEIVIPAQTLPPPEQVTQIPFGSGIHELSWAYPQRSGVTIDNYTVFWCKDKGDQSLCGDHLNMTVVSSDTNMVNISTQSEGRVYQGVAANGNGISSGIVWASCTILPGRWGAAEMKSLTIEHTGPTYLYLDWKLECSSRIGPVSGFVIEYCLTDSKCYSNSTCVSPKSIEIDAVAKRSYNITGLKPYSEYAVFISVTAQSKPSVKSTVNCAKTGESVPDAVTSVEITKVTNSSISMQWSPPVNINGILCCYLVHWNGQLRNVSNTSTYTLENLASFTEYNVSVSACSGAGCGLSSIAKSVITHMGRPDVPSNIQFKSINSSRAILSWKAPSASAGNLTYYSVKFQVYSDKTEKYFEETNVTSEEIVLPWEHCEADGESKYKLTVRAVNMLENGETFLGKWSEPQDGFCSYVTTPTHLTVIIPLVAVLLSLVLCIFCAVFSQHLWVKFNHMRDIGVKLPARLGTRQEDKSENHAIHIWTNHVGRDTDNSIYRPSPDEQSLLKLREEIELIQEDVSNDRESFGCDIIQNNAVCGNPDSPVVVEPDAPSTVTPSPGYILVTPQPSGYVTIPPLARGYIMQTLSPPPNSVSPSLPQCSIASLKQNGFNSISPKPCNSFPEPNNLYGDMVSPINST